MYYNLPGDDIGQPYQVVGPATVLNFCAQAFQSEEPHRYGFEYQRDTDPSVSAGRQQQLDVALGAARTRRDTAAVLRRFASPGQLLEYQIPAEDSLPTGGWTIYPPLGASSQLPPRLIADTRSIMGKTRSRTARDLHALGLLSAAQLQIVLAELAAGELLTEGQVCQRAATLALDVAVRPARQAALAQLLGRLRQAGVLGAAAAQRALSDSVLTKDFQLFEVLPHCARARVLHLPTLPTGPARLYPRVLAEVATLLPAFRPTAVAVEFSEQAVGDDEVFEQQVKLAFTATGRRYRTQFTQEYRRRGGQNPGPAVDAELGENFQAGINQWLRDQGAAERLYVATVPDARSLYGRERAGLLLLNSAQRRAWGPASYFLSDENHNNSFRSSDIEAALALYQRLGLFSHLTPAEQAAGRRQALGGEVGSYAALLSCFPRVLVQTGGEDAEEPQAYAKALAQVAAVTRGAFRPRQVRDDFNGLADKQRSTLRFLVGTRLYQAALESDLGWMDYDFVDLVQRAVRENTGGTLTYVGPADESGSFVFLTAAQAAAIRQAQPGFFAEADAEK